MGESGREKKQDREQKEREKGEGEGITLDVRRDPDTTLRIVFAPLKAVSNSASFLGSESLPPIYLLLLYH